MLKHRYRKKIFRPIPFYRLIPNIFTLIGLVIGTSSIRFAIDDRWEFAVYSILAAALIDAIDGSIARILQATSQFGAELDSLCDFVNFGICPAIIIYLWSFQQYEYKLLSWTAIMIFIVCMAIRLARFNSNITSNKITSINRYLFFKGIPAPGGAILVLIPMVIDFEISIWFNNKFVFRNHTILIDIYTIIIALLLASHFPTFSTKQITITPQYLSLSMTILALIIVSVFIYPWYILPIGSVVYLLSIPLSVYVNSINNTVIKKS